MTFPTQSPRADFMGNPIVFSVTEKPLALSQPVSFHQVHLCVNISIDGKHVGEYELSQPFSGTTQQTILFDVSSCFRAAADSYEYKPITTVTETIFPVFTASVHAYSSYMMDGARITTMNLYPGGSNEGSNPTQGNKDYTIVTHLGRYSDFERRQSAVDASLSATLSRKPTSSPELVFAGDTVLFAEYIRNVPATRVQRVTSDEGVSFLTAGHQYHVCRRRRGSVQFQFVNSRGCIESIRAFALPAEKANLSQTEHIISRFEQFSRFARTINRKHQRPSEFSLSSGPVDYLWARWWFYEFCQAEHVWMLADAYNPFVRNQSALWVPVNIKPSDSTSLIDFTKTELLSVEFSVIPDINGPMF